MPKERNVSSRAIGKHIGHAVEGHCRGLFHRLFPAPSYLVLRELPFDFPVGPDVVVLDADSKIRALGIVAYARDSKGTDKKFYRTRLEYQEILLAWRERPELFSQSFCPVTIIYGSLNGWKETLIKDLETNCPPTLFLPERLGRENAERLENTAFSIYTNRWEGGHSDAREYTEDQVAKATTINDSERLLIGLLEQTLSSEETRAQAREAFYKLAGRPETGISPTPFHSRLRQGLSLASLFPDREISSWLSRSPYAGNEPTASLDAFLRRACFLDLVNLSLRPTLMSRILLTEPRRPIRVERGRTVYAPDRPDFEDWERLSIDIVKAILLEHRRLPSTTSKVFHAGALDQVVGNWREICSAWLAVLPDLTRAIKRGDAKWISHILAKDEPIVAESWQPSRGVAQLLPVWSLCAGVIAFVVGERSVPDLRRENVGNHADSYSLAERLVSEQSAKSLDVLQELGPYCSALLSSPLSTVAELPQPVILSLDEADSWLSAWYLRIVTNPSHNPLCVPMRKWLETRFPDHSWQGWPAKRSFTLSTLLPPHGGRVQWQFAGSSADAGDVVIAEVKSVTANNWGNKSKELYDRIAETRRACVASGKAHMILGVLDGDVDERATEEIMAGHAYDETLAIDNVISDVYGVSPAYLGVVEQRIIYETEGD